MKAVTCTAYGSADHIQITERDRPQVGDQDILVRTFFTTIQTADWRVRTLKMPSGMKFLARCVLGFFRPRQPVLGTEFSGVVEAVGRQVETFRPGDEVFGTMTPYFGAHAEWIRVSKKRLLLKKPKFVGFPEAAALSFGGLAALHFLKYRARVRPGDEVLILGASGAVGVAAVQIAKILGAKVTAVCSGKNFGLVQGLGADFLVDYQRENVFLAQKKYSVVFDSVGIWALASLRKITQPEGRIVLMASGFVEMFASLWVPWISKQKVFSGISHESPQRLIELLQWIEAGRFRVVIDREYPLHAAAEAHRYVESRHKSGNVVLRVTDV